MKGRPIAYFQAIALLIIASLSQRTFYVAGIKGAGQQLRQKRPLKIAAKTVHHYADKDVPKTRGDSRRERQLQQSTSTAGGNSNFGAFEGGANTPPTEYVISGSDLRVPSLAPNVITTPTTAVPSQAPVLSASEKAYNTANTVIAGVNGNLDRGNGSSKGSTRSKTGSYATSSANPAAPKGSKKSYTISGAEATPRKKAKSKSGKKTKSATKLAKSSTGKASATGSYYAATSSSGKAGKGGKGGKGKSGVAGVEGTSEDGSTSTVSSGYEAPSGSSSPAPVSNAVGAPSPYAAPSGISYPQMGTNGNALIDCSAIREGTAATDAPNRKSFRVDANWILDETADFDQVAASVQNYLQFEVAPAIAGCAFNGRNRRRLQFLPNAQSLVSNIQFGTPSADATASCSTDQTSSVCAPTNTNVNMYYYGVDNGIGLRLLNFLQAAGTYPVNGLLGVANLNVFDSDGNRISTDTTVEDGNTGENGNNGNDDNNTNDNNGMDGGSDGGNGSGNGNGDGNGSGSDNGSGTSSQGGDSQGPVGGGDDNGSTNSNNDGTAEPDNTVAGAQGQEGESGADDGNSGLSKWSKILIGVSVATAFLGIIICLILHRFCCRRVDDDDDVGEKVDFDSLPPEQAIPRTVKAPSVIPAPTFLDDEDMSGFASPWPGSFGSNEEPGSPITQSGGTEVLMTQRGDTHVCNSATCEVCARNQQVRFLPTEPESFEELEQLPSDATRNYYVDDTVAL